MCLGLFTYIAREFRPALGDTVPDSHFPILVILPKHYSSMMRCFAGQNFDFMQPVQNHGSASAFFFPK